MSLLTHLTRVVSHENLSAEEAEKAMELILGGQASPAQIAAFLVALRMKGETVGELQFLQWVRSDCGVEDAGDWAKSSIAIRLIAIEETPARRRRGMLRFVVVVGWALDEGNGACWLTQRRLRRRTPKPTGVCSKPTIFGSRALIA